MFALLTILKWGVPALILAAPFILTALYPSARRFLMAAIPIPLFVLAALAAWLWLNQESAILGAVQVRVKEMVAGAELDAAKAVNEQLRRRNELLARAAEAGVQRLPPTEQQFPHQLLWHSRRSHVPVHRHCTAQHLRQSLGISRLNRSGISRDYNVAHVITDVVAWLDG